MSIKVTYKIELKNTGDGKSIFIDKVMNQFCRDASWGTHTYELNAVSNTIKTDGDWNYLEPSYWVKYSQENFYLIEVHFNEEQFNFESEGLAHFIGTIAGDVLSNTSFKNIVVQDIEFPKSIFETDYFPFPSIGVSEMRRSFFKETLKGVKRPIIAFSIKPRIGLNICQFGEVLSNISDTRIDIIEDDERILDPKNCSFSDRLKTISRTDFKKGTKYSINVTFPQNILEEKVREAYDRGIRIFKYDVMVGSFDGLLHLRKILNDFDHNTAITVFPDVYGKSYRHLSRRVVLKLCRYCGADIVYAGSPRWDWSRYGYLSNFEELKSNHSILLDRIETLTDKKNTLPTITHDVHPSNIEYTIDHFRVRMKKPFDFAFFIGGGISGFPGSKDLKEVIEYYVEQVEKICKKDISGISSWKEIPKKLPSVIDNPDSLKEDFNRIGWKGVKYQIKK